MSLFKRGYDSVRSSGGLLSSPQIVPPPEKAISLDPEQDRAVHATEDNVLVVAGAGSGKTRVLTERVKFLLESGVQPHNIVAITFTNMAAEEMKERLTYVSGIGDCFIGTIHSFANRIMKQSGKSYRIYGDDIDNQYHQELIVRYCKTLTYERYLAYKEAKNLNMIGKLSDAELSDFLTQPERGELLMIERSPAAIEDEIRTTGRTDFPDSVKSLCAKRGVITFDELLQMAETYFRTLGARVEHVLVDEFQDVGTLEFNFIEALNAEHYYFVGDDYQAIYGFKGGNVQIFLALISEGIFSVYYLTNNYRNSAAVLDMARTVIKQVPDRIEKQVVRRSQSEGSVQVLSAGALSVVLNAIKRDGDYKDYFVLTRTNKDLFQLAQIMTEQYDIPVTTFKREGMSLQDLRHKMGENRVKLLTVHVSKGLEAKNVVLYGRFPIICPSYLRKDEERKVMYVGVTRAMENLVIVNK